MRRLALASAGILFVGLAFLGAVLPVLPTTPFLLLAGWCLARSRPELWTRLLRHRLFRPYLPFLDPARPIPARARWFIIALVWTAVALSAWGLHAHGALSAPLLATLAGAALAGSIVIVRFRRPGALGLVAAVRDLRKEIAWRRTDARVNRRLATAERRFLATRYAGRDPHFYDVILDWAEAHVPEARARFELRVLPFRPRDLGPYVLHLPWLQDPVESWSPRAYEQACALTARCDAAGIPTLNRVDRLARAGKAAAAETIGRLGVRTPRAVLLDRDDPRGSVEAAGLAPPFLVREDWGHAGPDAFADGEVFLCEDLSALDGGLRRFARPVALAYVETRARDGLYRKFRSVVAGDHCVPHHVQFAETWWVKGLHQRFSADHRAEELRFLDAPDPFADDLCRAREALGLDVVAFDYSLDAEGRLVVWEANPYPFFHFLEGRRAYRAPAVERTLAALLHLYHARAGLDAPARLEEYLAFRRT